MFILPIAHIRLEVHLVRVLAAPQGEVSVQVCLEIRLLLGCRDHYLASLHQKSVLQARKGNPFLTLQGDLLSVRNA